MGVRFGTDLVFNRKQITGEERRRIRHFFQAQRLLGYDGTVTEVYRFPQSDTPQDIYLSVEKMTNPPSSGKAGSRIRKSLEAMPLAMAIVQAGDFLLHPIHPMLQDLIDELSRHQP